MNEQNKKSNRNFQIQTHNSVNLMQQKLLPEQTSCRRFLSETRSNKMKKMNQQVRATIEVVKKGSDEVPAEGYAAQISPMEKLTTVVHAKQMMNPQIMTEGPPSCRPGEAKMMQADTKLATSVNPNAKFMNEPSPRFNSCL
jgi:hypothetical protein